MGDNNDCKEFNFPGVNLALLEIAGSTSSVRVVVTKVVTPLYKKGPYAYISLKDRLDDGEVIRVGAYEIHYRSKGQKRGKPDGGILHRVVRVDGENITQHDIDGIKKGDTAFITNRRTYTQIFNQKIKPYTK